MLFHPWVMCILVMHMLCKDTLNKNYNFFYFFYFFEIEYQDNFTTIVLNSNVLTVYRLYFFNYFRKTNNVFITLIIINFLEK